MIWADRPEEITSYIEERGGIVESVRKETLEAILPLCALTEVAELREVRFIELPFDLILYADEVVSEGVSIVGADAWHRAGWDGKGVKVAIIDSFRGFRRLLGDELPEEVIVRTFPQELQIEGDPEEPEEEASHGTAIAEVIHDLAPQATLYLVNSSTGHLDEAIAWLVEQEVDIINTSWGLFTGCYGGDGLLDPLVEQARRGGILWITSAGNHAQEHWEGDWQDLDQDGQLDFPNGKEFFTIEASRDEEIRIYLSWNDPCGRSNNDYDLYLYNSDLTRVISDSTDIQNGDDRPQEAIIIKVEQSGTYRIVVRKKGRAIHDKRLELFTVGARLIDNPVPESSMIEPASSSHALTVGATDPSDNTIRIYSSRGPTNDGRVKPDLAAPDSVRTATYGRFPGTSASAPHVAGAAALVKQAHPDWSPAEIQGFLEARAEDLGRPGKDNEYGAGLLMLGAPPPAIAQVPPSPTSLSVEPVSATETRLRWQDNSPNEDGFKIERRLGRAGSWREIARAGANTTTYIDTGLQPGREYCYRVRAYNSAGDSSYSNEACTATPSENRPPIARAGPDQVVNVAETVQLDGRDSHDPDGDELSYRWRFLSRPGGSEAVLSNPNSARPSFVADVAGEYLIQLIVNDGKVDSEPDQVKITAKPSIYEFAGIMEEGKLGRVEIPLDIRGKLPALARFVEKPYTTLEGRRSDSLTDLNLELNESTGTILGKPTKPGQFNFLIAAEKWGHVQAYIWAQITINEGKQLPEEFKTLLPGVPERGTVEAGQLKQYAIKVLEGVEELLIRLKTEFNGALNLYLRYGQPVEVLNGEVKADFFSPLSGGQSSLSLPHPRAGVYYIAVQNSSVVSQEFTLFATTVPLLEPIKPGMTVEGTVAGAEPGRGWLGLTQYVLEVQEGGGSLKITLENLGIGRLNLHIRYGSPVQMADGRVAADISSAIGFSMETIILCGSLVSPGKYYIAVENLEPYMQLFRLKVSHTEGIGTAYFI